MKVNNGKLDGVIGVYVGDNFNAGTASFQRLMDNSLKISILSLENLMISNF